METNWKPGDIIEFCDELYEIIENYGSTGKVKELHGTTIINKFYWEFNQEKCVLVKIANISFDYSSNYTGTPVPTDYKFVCWVGDKDEKRILHAEVIEGREFIQVSIPL